MIVIFRLGFFFSFFFDDFKFSTFANGKMASKGVENGLVFVLSLPHVTKCLENKKKVSGVVCQGAVGGAQAAGEYGKWFGTLCEQVFCRLAWLCVSVGTDAVHVRIQYLLIMFSQLKFSIIIPHTIETCRKIEKERKK